MNKTNAFALCASGVALLFAGVIIGMVIGKPSSSFSAVTQSSHDREAEKLESQAKLAEEIARRSAEDESYEREISRLMCGKFDRLVEINARENLYDSEKEESREIFDRLKMYYGNDLGMVYNRFTGKVKNVVQAAEKGMNINNARILKFQEKAAEDARDAEKKRMKSLEYAAKR